MPAMKDMQKDPQAERPLAQVSQFIQSGDLERARALCEQVLAQLPQDAGALLQLGLIAMSQYRWAEAIAVFDRALRIRADPWLLGNLGNCYWKTGQLDEAEYCLRGAIELKPDFAGAHVSLAMVLHGLHRFEDALMQLAAAEKLGANDRKIELRRGCTLTELGRYDEAQQCFARSAQAAGEFVHSRLVAFDRASFDAITVSDRAIAPPQPALQGEALGDFRYVVLISCNPSYVRKYGFPFMRSFAENAQGENLLHLHVYDPDERILDEIRQVTRQARLARFAVTTEASPFPEHEAQQRKAYYACGRLVHLPYWLECYRRPVLSLDVDFIVEGRLDALIDAAAGYDLGLNRREPIDSPWLDVIANIIVANPTAAARRYLAAVGNYALQYLEREREAWLVDQTALFCVLKMLERFARPPTVTWFAWIMGSQPSGLWHIGHAYDHLLSDPRYQKYAGDA
jgi:tetratricopeptide (TPR) repeat protein